AEGHSLREPEILHDLVRRWHFDRHGTRDRHRHGVGLLVAHVGGRLSQQLAARLFEKFLELGTRHRHLHAGALVRLTARAAWTALTAGTARTARTALSH